MGMVIDRPPFAFPPEALHLFRKNHLDGQYLTAEELLNLRWLLGLQLQHESALDPSLDRPPPDWLLTLPERLQNWRYVAELRRRLCKAVTP